MSRSNEILDLIESMYEEDYEEDVVDEVKLLKGSSSLGKTSRTFDSKDPNFKKVMQVKHMFNSLVRISNEGKNSKNITDLIMAANDLRDVYNVLDDLVSKIRTSSDPATSARFNFKK